MRYCINPDCQHRENQGNQKFCRACGTGLEIDGRYEILSIMHSNPINGWEVFGIRSIESSQEYILKTLAVRGSNRELIRLFDGEKNALINLENPGIPKYEDDFMIPVGEGSKPRPKLHCLLMELIEGQDLNRWLKTHRRLEFDDRKKAIKWLREITSTLDYVHSQDHIHRDIKPSNIILRNNDRLALIDFGIAKEIDTDIRIEGARTRACTDNYAAPEQLDRPAKAYPESDFFALGKTFVHLLTGNIPEPGVIGQSKWGSNTGLRNTGIIPLIERNIKKNINIMKKI